MKRTTIMVAEQRRLNPPENPLLALIGLGSSDEPTDVADGGDEEMLRERLNVRRVFTLDHRHFRIIRPLHVPSFELLP